MEIQPDQIIASARKFALGADLRKGQQARAKMNRAELEAMFRKGAVLPTARTIWCGGQEFLARYMFINHVYPPSIMPTEQLEPMHIPDLRLETRHEGRVLLLRTIGHPLSGPVIQNAVEDDRANVDVLALCNIHKSIPPNSLLPKGAVVAIKEPLYEAISDGKYQIRVDHPSDLVFLSGVEDYIPLPFRSTTTERSAADLNADGNAASAKKDLHAAVKLYSEAMQVCPDQDRSLRAKLRCNRAEINLLLGRFEPALSDAEAAISDCRLLVSDPMATPSTTSTIDSTSYFRGACTAYGLRDFAYARSLLQEAQRCRPGNKTVKRELERTEQRIQEEQTGGYDFDAMSNATSLECSRLDFADFIRLCEVRDAGGHGKGLFATTKLGVGSLVHCEKAFAAAFASEEGNETTVVYDLSTERGNGVATGPNVSIVNVLMEKLSHNPRQAARFQALHDADYEPKLPPSSIDGKTVIDSFRTTTIATTNRFGLPSVRSSEKHEYPSEHEAGHQHNEDSTLASSAVWIVASHINHACDGNVVRAFMGDMIIFRATREIQAGEEILTQYCGHQVDSVATQAHTKKGWGFECDCAICQADAGTSQAMRTKREALVAECKALLEEFSALDAALQYIPDSLFVAKAEKLREQLQTTYPAEAFTNRPRPTLNILGMWLCQAYVRRREWKKAIISGKLLLRDLGYVVRVLTTGVDMDYANCSLETAAVDAAVGASKGFFALGNAKHGQWFEDFARRMWMIEYGELRGYAERYGRWASVLILG
ncbi:hypothetical protein LTR56_015296 [Elasticomyces elasticus]|nr:hypothetical protein LTR56_015296 [Elasticomyces elasticus]KAK3640394.1 hypothetical protein LTR22_017051 [Elasticomyces elasticus]KAK4913644.1 hypothetical protein LTR49_018058 [Elasticomyces elasticus]KAK5753071.1 hypothetical protein LTS12_016851 [Elasticomyces elasticus]